MIEVALLISFQYGLNSVPIIADIGGVYLNFGLWGLALVPGWLVIKEIGESLGDKKVERERGEIEHEVSDAKII